jgi:hypothetical protein
VGGLTIGITITLCISKKIPKLDLELKKVIVPGEEVCLLLVNTGEVSASQVKVKIYMPKNIGDWRCKATLVEPIKESDTLIIVDYGRKTIDRLDEYYIEIKDINSEELRKLNKPLRYRIECKETYPVEKAYRLTIYLWLNLIFGAINFLFPVKDKQKSVFIRVNQW